MPSKEFMQQVLTTGSADAPRAEVEEEAPEEELVVVGGDEEEDDQPAAEEETEEEADEEVEEVEEEAPEGEADDEEGEAEEEPEPEQDAEVYDGVWNDYFGSPEEVFTALQEAQKAVSTATKRERDTRAWGQQNSREKASLQSQVNDLREALAYATGRVEAVEAGSEGSEDFDAWAESALEDNAAGGFEALRVQAVETGDFTWAHRYVEKWGQEDPFRASRAGNLLDMQEATLRLQGQGNGQQQPQASPVAEVVGDVLTSLRTTLPDLEDGGEVLAGTIRAISQDAQLHAALRSTDPVQVSWAITSARERHLASQRRGQRPKLSRGAQAEISKAKARGTVATGTRVAPAPEDDDVPPAMRGSMKHFEKWGMVRKD